MATINTDLAIRPGQKLKDTIVPTTDTARYAYLMDIALKNDIPMLVVGPTGM
jgi:dynein heavy chain